MSLRFHEIAEAKHRILNPITEDQVLLLGQLCGVDSKTRMLDLACGKGEMLCQWALHYDVIGVGVDVSPVFIEAAKARGFELAVWQKVNWVQGDAAEFPLEHHQFDLVSCMGATWIGGGLRGTLDLMRVALNDAGGILLVGEPYWHETPPDEAYSALDIEPDTFVSLDALKARFEDADTEVMDMVLSTREGWDNYILKRLTAVDDWLEQYPYDPDAQAMRKWNDDARRTYELYEKPYMGWAAFVLRVPGW